VLFRSHPSPIHSFFEFAWAARSGILIGMTTLPTSGTSAEENAVSLLLDLFGRAFSRVHVLHNMIYPTGENTAVKTTEVDALVICNAGIFLFEVKGWVNCKVVRTKGAAGQSNWELVCNNDFRQQVRDPLHQVGGKMRFVMPIVQDSLMSHLSDHTLEAVHTVEALSHEGAGREINVLVQNIVNRIQSPNIRNRSYVLLPQPNVELDMNIPATVMTAQELPLVVRQIIFETKKNAKGMMPFSDAMVDRMANDLHHAGTRISTGEHIANVKAVYEKTEAATA